MGSVLRRYRRHAAARGRRASLGDRTRRTRIRGFLTLSTLIVVLALAATGCRTTKTYSWEESIKQSAVACKFFGNYDLDGGFPVSVSFDCDFRYSGSGERPYMNLWLAGCTLRVNASDRSNWSDTRECLGDGIDTVKLQLCQTRGGPLPDDCDAKRTWRFD